MSKNFQLKLFEKKDLKELLKRKTGDVTLSFYLGIRQEINFRSEANSLITGQTKKIKRSKKYSKSDKNKIMEMAEGIKKEINLLKLPDEARAIIIFLGANSELRAYRFPAFIPSKFVIESDIYIHPALVALENFPKYLSAIVERDRAVFFTIFSGQASNEPEILTSDVPKRIRTSAADDWKGRREMRIERHIEDHLSFHLKKVSAKLTDLLVKNGFDYFLIGVHKELEARFTGLLDRRVRDKVIGFWSPAVHYDINEIKSKSIEMINSHERRTEESAVRDLVNGANEKNWKSVLGIESVLEHLYLHDIDMIAIGKNYKQSGYLCPNRHYISTHQETCPLCKSKMMKVGDLADEILEEAVKRKINFRHLLYPHKDFDRFGIGVLLKT